MGKIVLNAELAAALRNCKAPAQLCDSDGNVIGYFEPPVCLYEPGEIPEFDEEELDRREARHEVMTSEEVRRGLGIPPRK
jgi:hypothetical protein